MVPSDRADASRREIRVPAALATAIGLVLLSGCVADGPVFAPMAMSVAPSSEDGAKLAAADPDDASSGRVSPAKSTRVAGAAAAKSARLARNEEEGGERAAVAKAAARNAEAVAAVAVPASAPARRETGVPEIRQASLGGASISGSSAIDQLIEKHAAANGIPAALAYAVVRVESRYDPKARGAGVYGLSQIMPSTARSLGFSGPTAALYDADTNLTYGMRYLKGAWEKGGHDVCRAAMKYKGGHRTTRMSASAARYCSAVKAHMAEVAERRRMPSEIETPAPEKKGLIETVVAAVTPAPAPATPKAAKVRGLLTPARGAIVPSAAPRETPEAAPAAVAAFAPEKARPAALTPETARTLAAAAVPAPRPSVQAGAGIPAAATAPAGEDVLAERLGGFGDADLSGESAPSFAAN
ncbi:transglycosylase SLT domain-containing protein [Aurantimonas sp. Leaf443]|uniref:lytic transglycosylase domain-containing protein n=1 Tax=Aurantimonas sp. Leaf443 TaxID=1736378 RepID=UPI0006F80CEB|nr:transglycosylase SLT domain-containing protein [Aurantimonas sp. Leaf443]KQT85330.1 hypothetical protein ASG48_08765 [Aurantimonas sp. Leaf443]